MLDSIISGLTRSAVLPYMGIALITWIIYTQLMRPLLSPLRKLPGPSFKPLIGNFLDLFIGNDGKFSDKFAKWGTKYGHLYRIYGLMGKTMVVTTDPDVIKHITVTNTKNYTKPRDAAVTILENILGEGLVTLEGAAHATHKRLMSPSFNNASIKKMIPVFDSTGKKLTRLWLKQLRDQGHNGKVELDIQNDLSSATLDIIAMTAFGYDMQIFENPDNPVNIALKGLTEGKYITWRMILPLYFNFPFPDVMKLKRATATVRSTVSSIIHSKRKLLKENPGDAKTLSDILGIMMVAKDELSGQGLSEQELIDEVQTLMGAGHETTSTGMAWFLLAMAEHPEIQAKCQEEVKEFLPTPDTPITMEVLDNLKYLDMTIKESLRLFPPVPAVGREAQDDDTLPNKCLIPAGTLVVLGIRTIMRSPDYFEDPETFKPERFDLTDEEANRNLYRFLPFIIGPRMCLGYKFALLQMKTMLACFLRELNFSKIPGKKFYASLANRITLRPAPSLVLNGSLNETTCEDFS